MRPLVQVQPGQRWRWAFLSVCGSTLGCGRTPGITSRFSMAHGRTPEGPEVTAGQRRSAAAWCRPRSAASSATAAGSPGCGERAPQSRGLVRVPRDGQRKSSSPTTDRGRRVGRAGPRRLRDHPACRARPVLGDHCLLAARERRGTGVGLAAPGSAEAENRAHIFAGWCSARGAAEEPRNGGPTALLVPAILVDHQTCSERGEGHPNQGVRDAPCAGHRGLEPDDQEHDRVYLSTKVEGIKSIGCSIHQCVPSHHARHVACPMPTRAMRG